MISAERAKTIADLYYEEVYRLCLSRLRSEEDAIDVTQEVFLFFQENYEELDDRYIKAWLYAVANNKIKEAFRQIAKREKELIFGAVFGKKSCDEILCEMDEDCFVSAEEIEEKKSGILASLTERELELFEMVYVKHMEYEELAKVLGTTEHAIRSRVYRLKIKIKEKVSLAFMVLLLLLMKI